MKSFPEATAVTKKYEIDGEKGLWVRQNHSDARLNPEAIRATRGSRVVWFAPDHSTDLVLDEDLTEYAE